MRRAPILAAIAWLAGAPIAAAAPKATTTALVLAHPVFFHDEDVLVAGTFRQSDDAEWLSGPSGADLRVIRSTATVRDPLPAGSVEAVGRVWDVGRLDARDARLQQFAFLRTLAPDRWPARGTLVVFALEQAMPAHLPSVAEPEPSIRDVALYPEVFRDQSLTVTGQFHGANLYGENPTMPPRGRWNYVLGADGASLWVTGVRPRGTGFDLDPHARLDTNVWLRVTGTFKTVDRVDALVATAVQKIAAPEPSTSKPAEPAAIIETRQVIAPDVVFSEPLDGETDIPPRDPVRIQFSREMKEETFAGRVVLRYEEEEAPRRNTNARRAGPTRAGAGSGSAEVGRSSSAAGRQGPPAGAPVTPDPQAPAAGAGSLPFTLKYDRSQRAITITPEHPFEPLRRVRVSLREGITAIDGVPLKRAPGAGPDPAILWTIAFTTGR